MDAALAARERLAAVQERVAAYNAAVGGRGILEGALKALGDVRAGPSSARNETQRSQPTKRRGRVLGPYLNGSSSRRSRSVSRPVPERSKASGSRPTRDGRRPARHGASFRGCGSGSGGSMTGARSRRPATSRALLAIRSCGNGSASSSMGSSLSNGSQSRRSESGRPRNATFTTATATGSTVRRLGV